MDIRRVALEMASAAEKIAAAYPERMRKISCLTRKEDRMRSLAAGLLLCETLDAPKILYDEKGKPYAPDGPHFNLSHSGDYALLAVDDSPVGVDIEKWETWFEDEWPALSRFTFHEDERAVMAGNGVPSAKAFFDMWTLKESYVKMLGAGLSAEPTSFAVKTDGVHARIESDPGAHLRLYELEGYSAALCAAHPNLPDKILEVIP
ncbi:MAG: 4'-phosphopantetheinyl transferase superfamily protein [Synergistaceae bacterium]|nr:4'-phosphopantetheinyl transferase superfamily protein [Synergistaceae bacterium]